MSAGVDGESSPNNSSVMMHEHFEPTAGVGPILLWGGERQCVRVLGGEEVRVRGVPDKIVGSKRKGYSRIKNGGRDHEAGGVCECC